MAENAKKLSINQVKKNNKKYEETQRIYFDNEEFYIDIVPNFDNIAVKTLFEDMGKMFSKIKKANIEIPDGLTLDFIECFIIKNFSNMAFPDDPKRFVQFCISLIKGDYFEEIMNSYPKVSIKKVFDRFYGGLKIQDETMEIEKQMKSEAIKNELDNESPSII